jgi:DNA-binding NtrC family response regulator
MILRQKVKFMARVLISEASAELGGKWRDALMRQGHDVILAADGRAAVSACQQAPFEVVITDMSLPDVNGILLSGQISTILPDVQIIGVSAVLTQAMIDEDMDGQVPYCARFFCKPVSPKVLTAAVNELAQAH